MSFKRLDPQDFLISTDAIVAPAFAAGISTNTGTAQGNSGVSADTFSSFLGSDGKIEFSVAKAQKNGAGNTDVVYKQFANIIEGNSEADLPIGDEFLAITVERSRFKQSIFPPSFQIISSIGGCTTGSVNTGSNDVSFGNAGREYSNTAGTIYLYPDIGISLSSGTITLPTSVGIGNLSVDSEEVITSNYVFIRARNAEFNYSQNPTFIDSTTGGVRFTDFITAPQTFITTVGLYNDNGDLLAVAKLSKPLKKDFTKEALIRIKLDF